MTSVDRKTRLREYKETPLPMGVYRVRNTAQKKSLIGTSVNLPGILNRQRFQLSSGVHRDPEMQQDWNRQGADAFLFEVLDTLKPKAEPDYDPTGDLAVLLDMWTEKVTAAGDTLYRGK